MRVISKKTLVVFYQNHKDAETALEEWYQNTKKSKTSKTFNEMTRLENETQYEAAMSRIEELLKIVDDNTPADDKNSIELVILSNLVADYEDIHYPIAKPSLVDILKLRMYEMGLNQSSLAKLLGMNQSKISEIISGKSEPTLKQARTISKTLNISPTIVLGV